METAQTPAAGGSETPPPSGKMGWKELYLKEDWWAIWLGVGIVLVAWLFFINGSTIKWIAVTPKKWHDFGQLTADFGAHIGQYLAQFVLWLVIFCVSVRAMGHKLSEFIPSFIFVYIVSIVIFMIGAWDKASYYNLEPPLVALVLGLLVSNFVGLPKWMDTGFRVEYLHQDRHRAAGRDAALHADRLGGTGRDRAGVDRLDRHLPRDLFRRQEDGARPALLRHAGRGRRGVRRFGRDRDRRRGRREEGACADRHHHGDRLGDRDDLRPAARLAHAGTSDRRRRRVDRHLGVRRRRGLRRRAGLWQPRRPGRGHRRHAGRVGAGLHADEGGRARRLDRHLGLRDGDHRHHPVGSADRQASPTRPRSGGASRSSSSASRSPRCSSRAVASAATARPTSTSW